MKRTNRGYGCKRWARLSLWALVGFVASSGCGGGGGGGGGAESGPGHVPVYLAGNVRFARIQGDGRIEMDGHGTQLGPLALALAFSGNADGTIGYDARALPPLPDPFAIAIGATKGAFDVVVAPEEVFELVYNAGEEQLFVTTRGGIHLLVDARSLTGAPVVDGNLVHFTTTEKGRFSAVVDRVAVSDGQKLLALNAIGDFSIDGDGDLVATPLDCNDANPNVSPLADEIPNDGVDEDCDGLDIPDEDHDHFASNAYPGGNDCDDRDASINPDAEEILSDGLDNDCDGVQANDDDGDTFVHYVGGADPGPDCNDGDASVFPGAPEVFGSGVDHNCNGVFPGNKIMAFGDSITAGTGDPNYPEDEENSGYEPRLADLLGVPRDAVANRGRPSTLSSTGVDKIDYDLSVVHPDLVIIEFGANDSLEGVSVKEYTDNIKAIIHRIQVSGARAIISGVTHVCCGRQGPPEGARNAVIDDYNAALVFVAQDTGSVLVDMETAFQAAPGGLPAILADGLHPNAAGFDIMAAEFARVITTELY